MNQDSIVVYQSPIDKFYKELQWEIITQYPVTCIIAFSIIAIALIVFIIWKIR